VRCLLSITLLLLVGLPLVSPLFALGQTSESNLPACCRKNGAHHCMMSTEQALAMANGNGGASMHAKCPMVPASVGVVHHEQLSFDASALFFAEALSHPAQHRQAEAWARVALAGARHKRGPPTVRLS
jgi:hypothetical protein